MTLKVLFYRALESFSLHFFLKKEVHLMSSFCCLFNLYLEDLGRGRLLAYTSITTVKIKFSATPCDLMIVST